MIPLSYFASVTDTVLSAGSGTNTIIGLQLSRSPTLPVGAVTTFYDADTAAETLGGDSPEALQASTYFNGFTNSPLKPTKLYASRIATSPTGAELIGGKVGLTITQVQALQGAITIAIDGTVVTTTNMTFANCASFSAVAALLQAAIGNNVTVSYNSGTGGFIIVSGNVTADSGVSFASGTVATQLALTSATGAVQSSVITSVDIGAQMDKLKGIAGDFGTFFCAFDPSSIYLELAKWTSSQMDDVVAVLHDPNVTDQGGTLVAGKSVMMADGSTLVAGSTSLQQQVIALGYTNVAGVYQDPILAAAIASIPQCVDFSAEGGRITAAYRRFTGITNIVSDKSLAEMLVENGYNFYFITGGAGETFNGLYPGSVSGDTMWIDSAIDKIWMRRNFQLTMMSYLQTSNLTPYNVTGKNEIESALKAPIDAFSRFGAVQAGIPLTDTQIAQITLQSSSSVPIAIQTNGFYLLVDMDGATGDIRKNRQTPPITFWWTDGGSIQRLSMSSVEVQ